MKSVSALPPAVLHATTRPLAHLPSQAELLAYADPQNPLVWLRGDRGAVGVGETLRLRFQGPDRFLAASRAWRQVAATAVIDDPVRLPGSGLIAAGSFAFSASDPTSSLLVVPRIIVSRHLDAAWITEISTEPIEHEPQLPEPVPAGPWTGLDFPVSEPDPTYLAGVREATDRIERGLAEKIVLARQLHRRIGADQDLRVPLRRLAARYDDCWTYALDGMIGASPETLVRRADGAISARVLAGTRGRKPNDPAADDRARTDLLTSSKEQHEHAFAVQSVVTALSPHVRELHTSEEPYALALPNVWHLATELGAVPDGAGSSLELVAALHPTAAVAGTPTSAAVAAIAELEPSGRGRYAGPSGWIDAAGEGEWVISLRCAQIGPVEADENSGAKTGADSGAETGTDAHADADAGSGAGSGQRTLTAYAGGGIVAGSDPDREFGETVSKFAPIVDAFAPEVAER